jgi:hypothetical protein
MILAIDLAKLARRVKRRMVAGDLETMNRLSEEGKGLIVSENLAGLRKLRLGDTVELPTPSGPLHLPVVGIISDLSNQLGSIFIDRLTFAATRMTQSMSSVSTPSQACPQRKCADRSTSVLAVSAGCSSFLTARCAISWTASSAGGSV